MQKIFVILGEIGVVVLSFILGIMFVPGQTNTHRMSTLRWAAFKENPTIIENIHVQTFFIFFMLTALYALMCVYIIFMKKTRMPGKEFGTSTLMSPKKLNNALADLNNKPNDPMNEVIVEKKYSKIESMILNFKHRKDD